MHLAQWPSPDELLGPHAPERRAGAGRGRRPGPRRGRAARGAQGQVPGAPADARSGCAHRGPGHRGAAERPRARRGRPAAGRLDRRDRHAPRPRSSASRWSSPSRTSPSLDRVRVVDRTPIGQLSASIGERVTVRGWAQAIRDQKRMQFLILRDATGPGAGRAGKGGGAERAERRDLRAHRRVGRERHGHRRRRRAREARRPRAQARGARRRVARPSRSCRSPPTPRWTSGSTGATWTCAGRTGA